MGVLMVRDVMTIGVPVCREAEACGAVVQRLAAGTPPEVVAVLDRSGMSCGWLLWETLANANSDYLIGDVMEEAIPTVPPDIPAAAAALIMGDRGLQHLFLMHDWPGERRPAAYVSLHAIEQRLRENPERA